VVTSVQLRRVIWQFHAPEQWDAAKDVLLFLVQHSGIHSHCLFVIHHWHWLSSVHVSFHRANETLTGFLRSGKVREFWGSQGKSGKTERVGEKSGNFKILLTRPVIHALFSQFLSASGGFAPRPPPGLRPCKHCRLLVYIAIFYNGTKFSITFVYLVLFYWCRE